MTLSSEGREEKRKKERALHAVVITEFPLPGHGDSRPWGRNSRGMLARVSMTRQAVGQMNQVGSNKVVIKNKKTWVSQLVSGYENNY